MSVFAYLNVLLLIVCVINQIECQMPSPPPVDDCNATQELCYLSSHEVYEVLLRMREWWEDHVIWTRITIEQVITNSNFASESLDRLFRNQEDLGKNLGLLYCERNGQRYTAILRVHINYAVEVLTAILQGSSDLDEAVNRALANAREFAEFWHAINPLTKTQTVYNHMVSHIATLEELMVALNDGDAAGAVSKFDVYSEATRDMVDYLVEKVGRQRAVICSHDGEGEK